MAPPLILEEGPWFFLRTHFNLGISIIPKPRLTSTLLAAVLSVTVFPFLASEMPVEAPGLPTMRSLLRAECPDRRKKRKALRASRMLSAGYFGGKLCRVTTDQLV